MKIIHGSLSGLLAEVKAHGPRDAVRVAALMQSTVEGAGMPRYTSWVIVSGRVAGEQWAEWRFVAGRQRAEITERGFCVPKRLAASHGGHARPRCGAWIEAKGLGMREGILAADEETLEGSPRLACAPQDRSLPAPRTTSAGAIHSPSSTSSPRRIRFDEYAMCPWICRTGRSRYPRRARELACPGPSRRGCAHSVSRCSAAAFGERATWTIAIKRLQAPAPSAASSWSPTRWPMVRIGPASTEAAHDGGSGRRGGPPAAEAVHSRSGRGSPSTC
jgi:hypothetical protein